MAATGPAHPAHDFTVAPNQSNLVLGAGEAGLVRSDDGGTTFTAVPDAPQLVFVDWSATGLYGLDAAGVMWTSTDGGTTWNRTGELGSQPGALTVSETGQLYAADEEGSSPLKTAVTPSPPSFATESTTHG